MTDTPTTRPTLNLAAADPAQEACRVALELFRQKPDWITFFREIIGVEGVIRRLFPNATDLADFEATPEYAEIQQMLATLREQNLVREESREPTRVITVRMPKSLHESLRAEAHSLRTSMNKLCITKLLRVIDDAAGGADEGDDGPSPEAI